jgi:hypothetical protein
MIHECGETFLAVAFSVLAAVAVEPCPFPADPAYQQSFDRWKTELVGSGGQRNMPFYVVRLPDLFAWGLQAHEEFTFGFGPISYGLCVIY